MSIPTTRRGFILKSLAANVPLPERIEPMVNFRRHDGVRVQVFPVMPYTLDEDRRPISRGWRNRRPERIGN